MQNAANPGWIETVNAYMPLVVFVLSVLLGLIGWFGRMMVNKVLGEISSLSATVMKQFTDARDRIEQVEKDFLRFQAQLPHMYTLKTDHLRHMTTLEHKIDENASDTRTTLSEINSDIKLLLRETPKRKSDG